MYTQYLKKYELVISTTSIVLKRDQANYTTAFRLNYDIKKKKKKKKIKIKFLLVHRFGKSGNTFSSSLFAVSLGTQDPRDQRYRRSFAISRCRVTRDRGGKNGRKKKERTSLETVKRKRTNLVTVYSISFTGGIFQ